MVAHGTGRPNVVIEMKKISFLFALWATIATAQSSFTIGTNSVPVTFNDTQLTVQDKLKICHDLNRVFAFESNFTNLISVFAIPDGNAIGNLRPPNKNVFPFRSRPEVHRINSQLTLVLHKQISDQYLACFADTVAQSNLLQQADAFVVMLNAGEAVNLTAEQKAKLGWAPEGYDQGTPEQHAAFAGYLSDFKFYPPSLLSARWLEVDLFPGRHLAMNVIAAPKNNLSKVFDMLIVYDGTQWRFVRL